MRKLTDSELVARTRETNRRRSARQRERLTIAGRAALTVWVPVGLRSRFVNEAAGLGLNINELAERLIEAGLRDAVDQASAELSTAIPEPDTADMFASAEQPDPTHTKKKGAEPAEPTGLSFVSVGSEDTQAALMREVGNLLSTGLSGAEIARRLNAAGHRTTKGTELIGANLLREYRRRSALQK